MKKIFTMCCLLLLAGMAVNATVYYVAQNDAGASDSNEGTLEALPLLTIQAAADVAQAGDIVYIKEGTYRETVIPANSGTDGNSIGFEPFGEDQVTVSGTEMISGWTNVTGNIYKAPMAGDFIEHEQGMSDQVFVDGQMMNIARWPNNGLDVSYQKKALTTAASRTGSGPYTGTLTSEVAPPAIDYTGTKIFYYPDTGKWTWSFTGRIQSVSGTSITFETNNGGTEDGKGDYAEVSRYFLFDNYELLDAAGEWYHDKTTGELYLWVPDGSDPSTKIVEAKKRNFAFDLSEKHYIEVRGLEIFGATITTDKLAGIISGSYNADGTNTQYPWRGKGSYPTTSNIVLDNLEVLYPTHSLNQELHSFMQHGQHSGIVLGGYDHTVKNCHIRYCSDNGISVLGYRHKVINNVIEDVNYYARIHSAIAFGGSGTGSFDHDIGYNTIRRCGRSGIENHNMRNSDPNNLLARIHHNDISEVMLQDNDGAGIRMTGYRDWVRIDHNYVHDINNRYINSGIYVDWGGEFIIDHNVVQGVWSSFHFQHGDTLLIYNNTVLCQNPVDEAFISGPFSFSGAKNKTSTLIQNNIAAYYEPPANGNYKIYQNQSVYDVAEKSNNLFGVSSSSVGFTNPPYELDLTTSATEAIDKGSLITDRTINGVTIPAFNNQVVGSAPDIGAYEYGSPKWLVGAFDTTYVITIVANNGTTDVVSGSEYPKGAEIQITASGNLGYGFDNWTGDVDMADQTDNPLTIILDADKTITANFVETSTFILTVSDEGNGSVTFSPNPNNGQFNSGDVVVLTPNPDVTYKFDKWTGDVDVANETDNPLTVTMNSGKNITASFTKRTDIWYDITETSFTNNFTGAMHSNDEVEWANNGGWTGITFSQNDNLTIANAGKKWSDIHFKLLTTTVDVSSDAVLTFTLKSDKAYTYNVRLNDESGSWGGSSQSISINGDNQFHEYTIDFTGSAGLDMTKIQSITWWYGGQDDNFGTWVLSDLSLGSASTTTSYTLTIIKDPVSGGEVSGGGVYDQDSVVSVTATPAVGYKFDNWSGASTSTAATIDIIMDSDKTLTAHFSAESSVTHTLTTLVDPAGAGLVSPSGSNVYNEGVEAEVVATPNPGYDFISWSGASTSSDDTVTISMDSDKSLTATFGIKTYTLSAGVNDNAYGTILLDPDQASYDHGSMVTLTALPAEGYKFDNWSGGSTSSDSLITVTMDEDKSFTANFSIKAIGYTLTTMADPTDGGSVIPSGSNAYNVGTEVIVIALPAEGYWFDGWTGIDETNDTVTIIMDDNLDISANFSIISGISHLSNSKNRGKIKLFPNPVDAGQTLNIELSGFESKNEATISIMDISGRIAYKTVVQTQDIALSKHSLDISNLSTGIYMVVVGNNNKVLNQRLIVK